MSRHVSTQRTSSFVPQGNHCNRQLGSPGDAMHTHKWWQLQGGARTIRSLAVLRVWRRFLTQNKRAQVSLARVVYRFSFGARPAVACPRVVAGATGAGVLSYSATVLSHSFSAPSVKCVSVARVYILNRIFHLALHTKDSTTGDFVFKIN